MYNRHHTWIGHPRAAFNLDNKHIAVYSESNVFASINVESGEIGKPINEQHHYCHLTRIYS